MFGYVLERGDARVSPFLFIYLAIIAINAFWVLMRLLFIAYLGRASPHPSIHLLLWARPCQLRLFFLVLAASMDAFRSPHFLAQLLCKHIIFRQTQFLKLSYFRPAHVPFPPPLYFCCCVQVAEPAESSTSA